MSRFLERWPLIIVGLILMGWAVTHLSDQQSTSETQALVLGLGVFLLGAGTALVILGIGRGDRKDRSDDDD
jgi:hypothetical protein